MGETRDVQVNVFTVGQAVMFTTTLQHPDGPVSMRAMGIIEAFEEDGAFAMVRQMSPDSQAPKWRVRLGDLSLPPEAGHGG